MKTVIALGYFDGIHLGHAALVNRVLDLAAELGAQSAVLTFDRHPDEIVRHEKVELINSRTDRIYILKELFGVNAVYFLHFNEQTMHTPWEDFISDICKKYEVCHVVAGYDFHFGDRGIGDAARLTEWCGQHGLGCDIIPAVKLDGITVSSTYIRTLLAEGKMEEADRFLGHPYLLTGTVVPGRQNGHKMNIPTVNLHYEQGVLVPRRGVYISRAVCRGKIWRAITNIGVRPTFDGHDISVETNIFDFHADAYGEQICIQFLRYLRDEQRFDSPEMLAGVIRRDIETAQAYFDSLSEMQG